MILGDADPALLDSDEEERRPVAQALLRGTDRAFGLVVSQSLLAALFRVRVMATLASIAMHFRRVRAMAFRLISRTGIRNRSSFLSRPAPSRSADALRPGDRFPWLRVRLGPHPEDADIHALLDDRRFTLLLFGDAAEALGPRTGIKVVRIPVTDRNFDTLDRAGVQLPAFYLVRPDGHIASSGSSLHEQAPLDYLRSMGMRLPPFRSRAVAEASMPDQVASVVE